MNIVSPRIKSSHASSASQKGAVLYVALIVLILLALLGIVGMQVSGLQEKMSANYRNANLAFQNAEGGVRLRECYAEDVVNKTNNCAEYRQVHQRQQQPGSGRCPGKRRSQSRVPDHGLCRERCYSALRRCGGRHHFPTLRSQSWHPVAPY